MIYDVLLRRADIDMAKQILNGPCRFMATTQMFEYLCFEKETWFHANFSDKDIDHHPYVDAVLSFAQCEMLASGSLFYFFDS